MFDLQDGMETSDNYYVKLKGYIQTSEDIEEEEIMQVITSSCNTYLKSITLMQALDLVNSEQSKKLIGTMGDLADKINKFEISTVDAMERSTQQAIDVEIDPSLESQSQSKGLFGKIKSMFKR